MIDGKQMIADEKNEYLVLSSCFSDPETLRKFSRQLNEDDFSKPAHKIIYRNIERLICQDYNVNAHSVFESAP